MKPGEWLTAFLAEILPSPQIAAGIVRGLWVSAGALVAGLAFSYLAGDDMETAIRTLLFSAMVGAGGMRVAESWRDSRRAVQGNVKPWDVAAYEPPLNNEGDK